MKEISSVLLLCIFGGNFLFGQTFQQELDSIAQEYKLVGMSVGVMCNNDIVDLHHFGLADIGRNIPVTDSTMYRIASISKTITATALMILYDQELFLLDDDISDYLGYEIRNPNHPDVPITFRMLLSHTSSLQDGTGYSDFLSDTYNLTPPPYIKNLLLPGGEYYTPNMWRNELPGNYFTYSNCNYGLIGTLVEVLSGQRFDAFVRENLFGPLGIDGDFYVNQLQNINNIAVLYRNGNPQADNYNGGYPEPFDSTGYYVGSNGLVFAPQGGLRISAKQLLKFMNLHLNYGYINNEQMLDSTTISDMQATHWDYDGNNGDNYYSLFNRWGLGFHLTTNTPYGDVVFDTVPMVGHPGEAYGLISDMYFDQNKKFGFVFITNGYYSGGAYEFGDSSAFYKPEEAIFKAVQDHYYNQCVIPDTIPDTTSVSQFSQSVGKSCSFRQEQSNIIVQNIHPNGVFQLIDLTGKVVFSSKCNHRTISLHDIPLGIYIGVIRNKRDVFSGKIHIYSSF